MNHKSTLKGSHLLDKTWVNWGYLLVFAYIFSYGFWKISQSDYNNKATRVHKDLG